MTTALQKRVWYLKHKERIAEQNLLPATRDKRKEARIKYEDTIKGKITALKKGRLNDQKRWNTKKVQARKMVQAAVKHGCLIRGTCHCGKVGEGHHEDYDKPLEVIWLCRKHHREVHNEQVSRVKHPTGYVG